MAYRASPVPTSANIADLQRYLRDELGRIEQGIAGAGTGDAAALISQHDADWEAHKAALDASRICYYLYNTVDPLDFNTTTWKDLINWSFGQALGPGADISNIDQAAGTVRLNTVYDPQPFVALYGIYVGVSGTLQNPQNDSQIDLRLVQSTGAAPIDLAHTVVRAAQNTYSLSAFAFDGLACDAVTYKLQMRIRNVNQGTFTINRVWWAIQNERPVWDENAPAA